jgi:hypothetical protein
MGDKFVILEGVKSPDALTLQVIQARRNVTLVG